MGFHMSLSFNSFNQSFNLLLRGSMTYQTELSKDAFGNMTRINNVLNGLPKRLEGAKKQLVNLLEQQELAKEEIQKPFALANELAEKEARLALLDAELNIEGSKDNRTPNATGGREEYHEDFKPPNIAQHDGRNNQPASFQHNHIPDVKISPRIGEQQQRQVASAKSGRPSFLDEIRAYNAGQNNGKQAVKQPEKQEPPAPGKKFSAPEI
jgi:hypothetical protein